MVLDKSVSKKTSELLLQIKAIKLEPKNYFTWTSGIFSPIYCDNRKALSFCNVRNYLKESISDIIKEKFKNVEIIAGVATGAISIGTLVADLLELPFVYIRPEAKSHGRKNQIEGYLGNYKNIVVIEDLISTGKSSILAVDALYSQNMNILGMIGIFSYDLEIAKQNFSNKNIVLYTLSNYDDLIESALEQKYILESELEILKNWRKSPETWNKE